MILTYVLMSHIYGVGGSSAHRLLQRHDITHLSYLKNLAFKNAEECHQPWPKSRSIAMRPAGKTFTLVPGNKV